MHSGGSFRVRDALKAGMTLGDLRSRHLAAPFHGVRSTVEPTDVVGRCRAYAAKMRADAAFTSLTAARLWGVPLPISSDVTVVHVATERGTARALGRGVVGIQHEPRSVEVSKLDGLSVLSPASTWVSLANDLGLADLVAAGDFLVTPTFGSKRPALCDVRDLAEAVGVQRRVNGRVLRDALDLIRVGPLSRPESLTRVLAVTGGLPDPVPNLRVTPLLMFDLAWPRWRIALDYQGDGHRSASQFARDVRRIDDARHVGWDLMQITKTDLFDHPFDLLGRLRSRLAERGAPVVVVPASKVSLAKP
jgi:hypothetical protein